MNHYDTLGITDRKCSAADIKHAWRRASSAAHPDRAGGSAERMTAVNQAYEVLGNVEHRRRYDETGAEPKDAGPTVVVEARTKLMALFDSLLSSPDGEGDGDPIALMRAHLETLRAQLVALRPRVLREVAGLRRKLERLSAQGDNFLGIVLQKRIEAKDASIAESQRQLEVNAEMLAQLATYNFSMPTPEPIDPRQPYGSLRGSLRYGASLEDAFGFRP